jgi:membrane protein YdbS with pleckstrin-like domain
MIFVERPNFVGWIALLVQLPLQIFFTVWAGGFFGGVSSSILGLHGRAPFLLFGSCALVLIPCVAYFGKKLNYERTRYTFFDDHLEFEEGFFSRNRKVIRYRDILEVTLRKGILQRTCNLGTIYLATLATGSGPRSNPFYALGFGNISASGVGVRDIRDPDVTYDRIRNLIDAKRP